MIWFILRKLGVLVATVLATAVIVYLLLAAAPGARPDAGLAGWLGHALVGDFGPAADGGAVGGLIAARLAVTLPLALLALLIALLLGAAIAALAARRPGSWADRALGELAEFAIATPAFWLGMVLVAILAAGLHWLPAGGFVPWQDNAGAALSSLLLPALALAAPAAGLLGLRGRDALTAARRSGQVLAAELRGLTPREAMARHGRREALLHWLPAVTAQAVAILAGTVIVETVFYLPGLGRLILDAVGARDLAVVRGGLVVLMTLLAAASALLQLSAGWIDPRYRGARPE